MNRSHCADIQNDRVTGCRIWLVLNPFLLLHKMAIIICLYFYLVLRLHEADLKWQRDGKRTQKKKQQQRQQQADLKWQRDGKRTKKKQQQQQQQQKLSETTARDIQYLIFSPPINQARFYICASLSLLSGYHFYAYVHITSHGDVRGGS